MHARILGWDFIRDGVENFILSYRSIATSILTDGGTMLFIEVALRLLANHRKKVPRCENLCIPKQRILILVFFIHN